MRNDRQAQRRSVGKRIQQLRLQRRVSQERLAEAIDKGTKHIGQIERGEVNVGIDSLLTIAENLSVEIRDLFPVTGRANVHAVRDQDLKILEHASRVVLRIRTGKRRASRAGRAAPVSGWRRKP